MRGFRSGIVAIVRGYTGSEAEMSYTPKGKAVTKFRVAVGSGEKLPTVWLSCYVWEEHDAKLVQDVVNRKGLAVVAVGRLLMRDYQNKHYNDLYVSELQVETEGELKHVDLTDVKEME